MQFTLPVWMNRMTFSTAHELFFRKIIHECISRGDSKVLYMYSSQYETAVPGKLQLSIFCHEDDGCERNEKCGTIREFVFSPQFLCVSQIVTSSTRIKTAQNVSCCGKNTVSYWFAAWKRRKLPKVFPRMRLVVVPLSNQKRSSYGVQPTLGRFWCDRNWKTQMKI